MHTSMVAVKARVMTFLAMFAFLMPRPGEASLHGGPVSRRYAMRLLKEERAQSLGQSIGFIIGGSILLAFAYVIALTMFPFLTSGVAEAQADDNTTARDSRIIGLLPTLFLIILVLASLGLLFVGIKGLVGAGKNS